MEISKDQIRQGSLFEDSPFELDRRNALMRTMDSLNQKLGTNVIHSAATGVKR